MREGRAAGQLRRRIYLPAAIRDHQWLAHVGAKRGEVGARQAAAGALDIGGDALRQVACVKVARPAHRQRGERGLEFFLRQAHLGLDAPLCVRRQAVFEIGGAAGRVTAQVGRRAGDRAGGMRIHQQAFTGQRDRRRHQFLPRQLGVAAMRLFHARHHTGHRDRSGAMQVAVVLDARPGEQVGSRAFAGERKVLRPDAARGAHAEVDHLVALLGRAVQHHRPAAADTAHPGFEHAEREGSGDGRVDAIPARRQHLRANLGRAARLRRDYAALGDQRGFAYLL